jgi:hypothetical protein
MKDILIAVLKFILFILIIPLVLAVTVNFYKVISILPAEQWHALLNGVWVFVGVYFFIYHFKEVSASTTALLSKVFAFLGPLGNVAAVLFPVYAILVLSIYTIVMLFGKAPIAIDGVILAIISFLLMMHWVTSAKDIYEADQSFLKAHYFLSYALLIVWHLCLGVIVLHWATHEINLLAFFQDVYGVIKENYLFVYRFLFVDSSL